MIVLENMHNSESMGVARVVSYLEGFYLAFCNPQGEAFIRIIPRY
jgi:hypothetical protein